MKNALWNNCATLILFSLTLQAPAITFNGDATLAPDDKRFDGEPLIVSNCVLTVDGPHAFASLQLLGGAVLTHTHVPDGFLPGELAITNEPYSLHLTNPTALLSPGIVPSSIVVKNAENSSVYTNQIDYTISLGTNGIVSLQLVPGSSIPQDSTVLVNYVSSGLVIPTGLNLSVAGDTWISAGAKIDGDGRGFGPGQGPGAGRSAPGYLAPISGSGAGHGGFGGPSATGAVPGSGYGSALQPITKGSGGGSGLSGLPGGSGGGAVKLSVGKMLRLDGTITARGANGSESRTGGGSGGSVWLKAGLLVGSGSINADGGAGEPVEGGGGGGGRIALDAAQMAFNGSMQARGGEGYANGGAGSIYSKIGENRGELRYDNGALPGASPLLDFGAFDLVIADGSDLAWTADGGVASLLVQSNALLTLSNRVIVAASNVTIHAGGAIRADGSGHYPGQGLGAGKTESVLGTAVGGGGGYGGLGGSGLTYNTATTGGRGYGQFLQPFEPGSGGGSGYSSFGEVGSRGGGTIRLLVSGMLLCDGSISANGMDGWNPAAGGGSGGSIWMEVGSLAGSGRIAAIGGNGNGSGIYGGGGGGGGRISIAHTLNLFFGSISARGGDGYESGGAGVIYTKAQGDSYGTLLADNEGQTGAFTFLLSSSNLTNDNPGTLVIRRGAATELPFSQLRGLFVQAGGLLTTSSYGIKMVTISGNAAVESGGAIRLDGRYAQSRGAGPGKTSGDFAGGGGYGGRGGSPSTGRESMGGASYGEPFNAGQMGSAGGHTMGGAGGGVLNLTVANQLRVDGVISANGEASKNSLSGGGGSGGGLSLTAKFITGSGIISCEGGDGSLKGGGGGGGRIAISFDTNLFKGSLLVRGGDGNSPGGAGTISLSSRSSIYKDLIIDNGGRVGSDTPLPQFVAGHVSIRNGARISQRGDRVTCGDLDLTANAWIIASSQWFNVSNLFVDGTSGFNLDGGGYPSPTGPGAGESNPAGSGGAGHGGRGGAGAGSTDRTQNGSTYGDASNPTTVGSTGGSASSLYGGGKGGGMLAVTVSGKMILNGTMTASATDGSTNSGGGSGGSISLSVGTISGTGALIADGGNGGQNGGGGGGGRISVQSEINFFQGRYSVKGGSGYVPGGAGSLYLKQMPSGKGVLVFDNGGQVGGAPSVWGGYATIDLLISNGASVVVSALATLDNLTVGPGGSVLIGDTTPAGAMIRVSGNVQIAKGGAINANEKGYPSGQGPGKGGGSSGGGGYGGFGGSGAASWVSESNPGGRDIGSVTLAVYLGSGGAGYTLYPTQSGGVGGNGGGSVRLLIFGNLLLEGTISANGGNGMGTLAGGGSGGGIAISAQSITGSGLISANGGNGTLQGGGGGGGRITISSDQDTFTGRVTAYGGTGFTTGGAGTIYRSQKYVQPGTVYVDNGGRLGTNTSILGMSYANLEVANGGIVFYVSVQPTANLILASNGWLWTTQMICKAASLTIAEGGGILADGTGFAAGQGPGAGSMLQTRAGAVGGGGGYGGYGGAGTRPSEFATAEGGIGYGSLTTPSEAGSGGGGIQNMGGAGGGILNISLSGVMVNNGLISANGSVGGRPGGGGGAGGTVLVQCTTLTGSGTIQANGGDGNEAGGPGGGGRIALICPQDSFTGRITAFGGISQSSIGGAGTVCRQTSTSSLPSVTVDNNGQFGTNTLLSVTTAPYDLRILNGAKAASSGASLQLSNLFVGADGALTVRHHEHPSVVVLGNAVVEKTGRITVDGLGHYINQGPGAGSSTNQAGSGGGHGGRGGASAYQAGGSVNDSVDQPTLWGSGGGQGTGAPEWTGSEGGGAIRLFVGGHLVLNGRLTANGNDAVQDDAGGGAGGSILLLAKMFSGNGSVTAHGGAGNLNKGGGGGGGRIAVYAPVNVFAGTTAALGGPGFEPGQNGSVFFDAAQWPRIEGRVLNTRHQPVANLPLQASAAGLYVSAMTASDGTYSLSIPPLGSPMVCPTDPNLKAAPAFRMYEALTTTVLGQDYLVIPVSEVPALAPQLEADALALKWAGMLGVTYHVDSSTNLVDWTPYETGITCSIADQPMNITLPRSAPYRFFRLRAEY